MQLGIVVSLRAEPSAFEHLNHRQEVLQGETVHLVAVVEPLGAALLKFHALCLACFRARLDMRMLCPSKPCRTIHLLGSLPTLLVLLNFLKSARAVKALGNWLLLLLLQGCCCGLQNICDSWLLQVMVVGQEVVCFSQRVLKRVSAPLSVGSYHTFVCRIVVFVSHFFLFLLYANRFLFDDLGCLFLLALLASIAFVHEFLDLLGCGHDFGFDFNLLFLVTFHVYFPARAAKFWGHTLRLLLLFVSVARKVHLRHDLPAIALGSHLIAMLTKVRFVLFSSCECILCFDLSSRRLFGFQIVEGYSLSHHLVLFD